MGHLMTLAKWAESTGGDWDVWIHPLCIIATYDGMHTVFNRMRADVNLYHGTDSAAAAAATGLPPDMAGEVYSAHY